MVEKIDIKKSREKISKLIKELGRSETPVRDNWKKTITEHKKIFDEIKETYQKRQSQLRELVLNKQAGNVSEGVFQSRVKELQDELIMLEGKLLNLRIGDKV